jgi:hypothetical protein
MMSSPDPGELGIYGFRNRKDYSYDGYTIANATTLHYDRAWDVLACEGKQVILLGVPQTYPVKPINGYVVTDFLTPSTRSQYTHPPELKEEVDRVSGGYVLDVVGQWGVLWTVISERARARTAGDDRASGLRARSSRAHREDRRHRRPTGSQSRISRLSATGSLERSTACATRPDRVLWRSALAVSGKRWAGQYLNV